MAPNPFFRRLMLGLVITAASASTALAGGIERVDRLPTATSANTKIVIVDLRTKKACERASAPDARCLPASSLFDKANRPLSFYALRWLLGTIGLTGRETVVLYADKKNTAWSTAGLLYLAGQNAIIVMDAPLPLNTPGQSRGFSREAVYTAPMRDPLIRLDQTGGTLGTQLARFAHAGGTKAITVARPK